MRVPQRSGLFSGVAALACASVLLEISLARIYAALFGEIHAFLALSLSLVGAGVGGALLYVVPSLARPPALFARMATLAALASGATLAAVILLAHREPLSVPAPGSLPWLALCYAASTVPFALAGLALAAAIRHAAPEMPRLYLLDLVGGALGGLAAAGALRAGAPRAALAAAIFFAVAGIFFYLGSRCCEGEERAPGGLVATFVLGSFVLLAGDVGAPWLRLAGIRRASPDRTEHEAWTERSLISVDRPKAGAALMRLGGAAASPILDAKATPPPQPEDMAYALHKDQGPALVVGAGGGRDVRAALKAGQKDVVAVEGDRGVLEVMRGRYAAFSGNLFDKPEVHLVVGDGRSFARRTPLLFRNIVIPSADTVEASTTGALALSESRLHTLEGVGDFLSRLLPEGTLVLARADADFDRLLSLVTAALRRAGVAAPKDHLFACSAAQKTALLARRTPLAREDVEALRRHCRKHRFSEVLAPDRPATPVRSLLVAAAAPTASAAAARVADGAAAEADLTPPTDDRPFFAYTVPARRLPAVLGDVGALRAGHTALFALALLLAVGAVLSALGVLLPVLAARRRRGHLAPQDAPAQTARASTASSTPSARALAFFAAIGAGFALVELAVLRHGLLLLDLPAHELPAVLVILLVSAGVGGYLTARVAPGDATAVSARVAEALAVAAALSAMGLVPLARWSLGLGAFPRALLAIALLVPFGVLAGSLVPLGVKIVDSVSSALLPWCWALCAFAGATAMALGALCALNLGYSALLLGAGLAYLLAAATVPPAAAGATAARDDERAASSGGAAASEPPSRDAAGAQPEALEAAPIA
ncbi:hypothetical protein WMF39_23185 [Sorangium sp. So ce1504]|uniref:hypothetical protein n=1 Tax=Sorangium sp. So ce1504 TaxID=3133337 RepID=UPI003F635281